MNKKYILIIVGLLVVIVGVVVWNSRESESTQQPVLSETKQVETEIISVEKPASFDGVDMATYKNSNGYQISYPSNWNELNFAYTYGDQRDLSANHFFSPIKINKGLYQLLLKPISCEGSNSCDEYFSKYSSTEYSLFRIYVQKFDLGFKLPNIQIPDAQKNKSYFLMEPKVFYGNKILMVHDSL